MFMIIEFKNDLPILHLFNRVGNQTRSKQYQTHNIINNQTVQQTMSIKQHDQLSNHNRPNVDNQAPVQCMLKSQVFRDNLCVNWLRAGDVSINGTTIMARTKQMQSQHTYGCSKLSNNPCTLGARKRMLVNGQALVFKSQSRNLHLSMFFSFLHHV